MHQFEKKTYQKKKEENSSLSNNGNEPKGLNLSHFSYKNNITILCLQFRKYTLLHEISF